MENRITLLENKVNELYIIKDELQKFKQKEKEQNEIEEKNNRLFPESNTINDKNKNSINTYIKELKKL